LHFGQLRYFHSPRGDWGGGSVMKTDTFFLRTLIHFSQSKIRTGSRITVSSIPDPGIEKRDPGFLVMMGSTNRSEIDACRQHDFSSAPIILESGHCFDNDERRLIVCTSMFKAWTPRRSPTTTWHKARTIHQDAQKGWKEAEWLENGDALGLVRSCLWLWVGNRGSVSCSDISGHFSTSCVCLCPTQLRISLSTAGLNQFTLHWWMAWPVRSDWLIIAFRRWRIDPPHVPVSTVLSHRRYQ